MLFFLGFRHPVYPVTRRGRAGSYRWPVVISVCIGLWLAGTAATYAAIIPTGDVTPAYNGVDDPWVLNTLLEIGQTTTGTLTIDGGSDIDSNQFDVGIGVSPGSEGAATITGTGSTWTNFNNMVVGNQGTGYLNILNGASLTNESGLVSVTATGVGTVAVDGVGSVWTNTVDSFIGAAGSGTLDITNGGSVVGEYDTVGADGGTGIANVSGTGSSWTSGTVLIVGRRGGTGTLNVSNQGTVNSENIIMSDHVDSMGTATITGPGASWNSVTDITIGDLGSATLNVLNGGHVSGVDAVIGKSAGAIGEVTIDGAASSWSNTGTLIIGSAGTGTLNIQNGVDVNTLQHGYIGGSSSATGTATIDGAGSTWDIGDTLNVGFFGDGTLYIQNGSEVTTDLYGYVGYQAGSTGTVTIDGAGSRWEAQRVDVGNQGQGTLSIQNGGEVTTDLYGYIGNQAGSSGTVTVDGVGSSWNVQRIYVGNDGSGTLNIQNGGEVLVTGATYVNPNGLSPASVINLSGGKLESNRLELDGDLSRLNWTGGTLHITGSEGLSLDPASYFGDSLVVGSGSTLQVNAALFVGSSGVGTLNIQNGGTALTQTIGSIGSDSGTGTGTGAVTVQGTNSSWTNVGSLYVGQFSDGTLSIHNGGEVHTGGFVYIGSDSGSNGTATVSGLGSTWHTSDTLYVGNSGTGTLNIESGGVVNADSEGFIGETITATGSATITGTGSQWNLVNSLTVGHLGNGTLNVESGGVVSNGSSGAIGQGVNSISTATVTGNGSQWDTASNLFVGRFGNGTLDIEAGGLVATGISGIIADQGGSTGIATIDGTGSIWDISDGLKVGNLGTGTLNVQNGGEVQVTSATEVNSASVINLSGGKLQTGSLELAGDPSRLNWTGGDLHLTDQNLRVDNGFDFGNQLIVPSGGTLTVDGMGVQSVGNQGAGTLNIDGGTADFTAASSLVIGRFTGSNGVMNILNSSNVSVANDMVIGDRGAATLNIGFDSILTVSGSQLVGIEQDTPNTTRNVILQGVGTNSIGADLQVGSANGASGRYTIHSGLLDVNTLGTASALGALILGNDGTGSLNHNGGTIRINNGNFVLAATATGRGFYHLDGGTLDMQNNDVLRGPGIDFQFNFNAGTLRNPGKINFYLQQAGGTLKRDSVGTTEFQTHYAILDGDAELSAGIIDVDGALEIAKGLGSTSVINITDGQLNVGTGGSPAASMQVGVKGMGVVDQLGGAVVLHGGDLILGVDPGSQTGTYNAFAGEVDTNGLDIRSGQSSGLLNIAGGAVRTEGGNITTANGSLNVTLDGGVLDLGGGDITPSGSGFLGFTMTGGNLDGVDVIDLGSAFNQDGGTLAPGGSIGQTTIVSGYNLNAGTLEIELGGIGDPVDLITVIGNANIATLGTTLDLSALGGIAAGTYTILETSGGTVTGMFETVSGLELFGLTPIVQNTGTAITLTLAGDLIFSDPNMDGFVGIGDLNIVLANWNQAVTPGDVLSGDLNSDGFVGIDDLNAILGSWNLGTPPPPEALAAIPEPASLGLIAIGLMGCGHWRRLS